MISRFFWYLLSPNWSISLRNSSLKILQNIENTPFCLENYQNILTISAHNVVGQFVLKRCQKKREVMNYKILTGFSWKYNISVRIKALKIQSLQSYEVKWIPFIGRDCTLRRLKSSSQRSWTKFISDNFGNTRSLILGEKGTLA